MFNKIQNCRKCQLYCNQKPLLDLKDSSDVMFVGLSAKKSEDNNEIPLSQNTNSGKLIQMIENGCNDVTIYRTNLVKCLPLNDNKKLRYPTKKEMSACFDNLISEINIISPKIVFLLGEKVYTEIERNLNIKLKKWDGFKYYYTEHEGVYYVPIQHPSYIYVYKRKDVAKYTTSVINMINDILNFKH